jgi:hypothetical protein
MTKYAVNASIDDRLQVSRVLERFTTRQRKSKREIFYDLCFCICAPQTTFVNNRKVEEAKREFRMINQGTPLTEKEEAKTILTDLDDYSQWEARVLTPIHNHVNSAISLFGAKITASRPRKHSNERDEYGLFLRYATRDPHACKYSFDVRGINDSDRRQKILEQRLVNFISDLGIEESSKKVDNFGKFLMDEVQYLKSIWNEIDKSGWDKEIQTLTDGCCRLALHMAVFRRNANVPVEKYREFIKAFLDAAKGGSNVRFADGGFTVMSKGDLSRLPRLQAKLGVAMSEDIKLENKRKRRKTNQLCPGYHNSHKKSFAKNGEGETVPQTAVKNMSDGVLDME